MARILIVEDEANIAEGIAVNLEQEGHLARQGGNGREAVDLLTAQDQDFELVILDVMLPEMGGLEVARRVRAAGNYVAILMLTARNDHADIVRGLEEGADDYLTKPFRLDELLARVKGLLRRRRWDGVADEETGPRAGRFGDVCVHFDRFELETPEGVQRLTTRELGLLRALIESEGRAMTRGELLEQVWGLRADTRTRVIDSFIVRLRRYVEKNPSRPKHILSVRGHGDRFER